MRRQAPNPDQLGFDLFDEQPIITVVSEPPAVAEIPEGVAAVSLKHRADTLLFALYHIGQMRRLDGLSRASESDPHRRELIGRYRHDLGRIVVAGNSKATRSEMDGWREFNSAMGTDDLIAAGVEDPRRVRVDTEEAFGEFQAQYFLGGGEGDLSPEQAERNRARFRRILGRQFEHFMGQRWEPPQAARRTRVS